MSFLHIQLLSPLNQELSHHELCTFTHITLTYSHHHILPPSHSHTHTITSSHRHTHLLTPSHPPTFTLTHSHHHILPPSHSSTHTITSSHLHTHTLTPSHPPTVTLTYSHHHMLPPSHSHHHMLPPSHSHTLTIHSPESGLDTGSSSTQQSPAFKRITVADRPTPSIIRYGSEKYKYIDCKIKLNSVTTPPFSRPPPPPTVQMQNVTIEDTNVIKTSQRPQRKCR